MGSLQGIPELTAFLPPSEILEKADAIYVSLLKGGKRGRAMGKGLAIFSPNLQPGCSPLFHFPLGTPTLPVARACL